LGGYYNSAAADPKINNSGATPDCDESGNAGSGDNLDSGDWNDLNCGDAGYGQYDGTGGTLGGGVVTTGPSGISIDAIRGCAFYHKLAKSKAGTWNVKRVYGKKSGSTYTVTNGTVSAGRTAKWFDIILDSSSSYCPTLEDYGVVGFCADGTVAENTLCYEAFMALVCEWPVGGGVAGPLVDRVPRLASLTGGGLVR
jgi:hypothetical protein